MAKNKTICGFDCGGTNLKCYCNINGKEFTKSIPTGENFTKQQLVYEVTNFLASLPTSMDTIGIAFSGNGTRTHICRTPRKYLTDLDVSDFSHLNCNISFINDADAAAVCGLTEYPDAKVLVGITNGTGIGSGICINGQLFTGSNGLAGEISGNILTTVSGPARAWTLCSGSVLQKSLKRTLTVSKKKRLIQKSASNFGLLLTHVINALNPDYIYLSGGVFQFENYFETVVNTVNKHGVDYMIKDLKIVQSTKGSYTGCIGASHYAMG